MIQLLFNFNHYSLTCSEVEPRWKMRIGEKELRRNAAWYCIVTH